MPVAHVSFDVWNTLVVPNPEFARRRSAYLADALRRDVELVRHAYARVKHELDAAAERDGSALATPDVYARLFAACGCEVSPEQATALRRQVDALFVAHPPGLAPGLAPLLAELRARGITTSIASNSNFISGALMQPCLLSALQHEFSCTAYSDLLGHAKPAPAFFDHVVALVHDLRPTLARHDILHVGDHPVCDVEGARRAGLQALHVSAPEHLAEQLLAHLDHAALHPLCLA
jgi:putative hydrolase of the HAD superfamily